MINCDSLRLIIVPTLTLSVFTVASNSLWAESPASPELPVVFRISHDLIEELLKEEIRETIPFHNQIAGGQVWGQAEGKAQLHVEFIEDGDDAIFVISAKGEAVGCATGTQACFIANGTVTAPFTATQVVHFDGMKFSAKSMQVNSRVHGHLNSVRTRRNGPLGKVASRVARPFAESMLPDAEREATPIANQLLADFVKTEADAVIAELNQVTPFEQTVQKMFPQVVDWPYRLTTTKTHMIVAAGPKGGRFPKLPESKKLPSDAGIEVWLATTPEEAKFIETLATWNKKHDLLGEFLKDDPELKQLIQEAKVTAIGSWVVISVGSHQASQEAPQ